VTAADEAAAILAEGPLGGSWFNDAIAERDLARIDLAVARGGFDRAARLRDGDAHLQRSLEMWRTRTAGPDVEPQRLQELAATEALAADYRAEAAKSH
jgi:hypothetical protein